MQKVLLFYSDIFSTATTTRKLKYTSEDLFWDDFFLLRPNHSHLKPIFTSDVYQIKDKINSFFVKCVEYTSNSYDIRRFRATENICILLKFLFMRKFNNFNSEIINLLSGIANTRIFEDLSRFLSKNLCDKNHDISTMSLRLIVIIVTARENINQNELIQFLLTKQIYDALVVDDHYINYCLLGILVNYKKFEINNLFLHLIEKDSHLTLFSQFEQQVPQEEPQENMPSFLENIIAYFYPPKAVPEGDLPRRLGFLLLFYELLYLNEKYTEKLESKFTFIVRVLLEKSILFQLNDDNSQTYSKLLLSIYALLIGTTSARLVEPFEFAFKLEKKAPMGVTSLQETRAQSSLGWLFDSIAIFLHSNLRKKFAFDAYKLALSIVYEGILTLKKQRVRLVYNWMTLYEALLTTLKFSSACEPLVRDIFNLIVTFGDCFLYDTKSYDICYYEIIRNAELFSEQEDNIQAIVRHFLPKIEAGEDVMSLVKRNYDTLELRLSKSKSMEFSEDKQLMRAVVKLVCDEIREA